MIILNIDIRKYIITNFKNDKKEEIEQTIETSIKSKEEEPLLGMGVLFELAWINSDKKTKEIIINNIKKGIDNSD